MGVVVEQQRVITNPQARESILLDELAAALFDQSNRIVPLGFEDYVRAHEAFDLASSQQAQIRHQIESEAVRLWSVNRKPLRILSVGCGSGLLDLPLLERLAGRIGSFVGIDPNPVAIRRCRRRHQRADQSSTIRFICSSFEDLHTADRFDLIHCCHVLYYARERSRFLTAMFSLLRDSGVLLIAHAPKEEMNRLAQIFWSHQSHTSFYDGDVGCALESLDGCEYTSRRLAAAIPTDLFVDHTPQGRLLLEFLIQAKWDPLSLETRALVARYLRTSTCQGSVCGRVIPHPAVVFRVTRE